VKALICEHHRYDSALRVGSHQIAQALLDRGFDLIWAAHPRSWLHRIRGPLAEPVIHHPDGTVEVTLRAPLPYIGGLPPLGALAWGRRWLAVLRENRVHLRDALAGESCDLAWISDFTALPILDLVSARRVVLRYFDHLQHYPRTPGSIFALIHRYRGRADLEVVSSKEVQVSLLRRGIDAIHLPNAIHVRAFPAELALSENRKREAIYVGALREWFDFEAVRIFASSLPDVTFRLVGPDETGLAAQLGTDLPNVVVHGAVDHGEVAQLLSEASFGLIPFRRNALTLGVHPLKLFEYLATGIPVLSVDLPAVKALREGVFTYRDPAEGAALLKQQIDRPFDRRALRRIAEANDWSDRLDLVFELLDQTRSPEQGK